MTPPLHSLASGLRAARTALNWSQSTLGAHAGVATITIARIETLKIAPKPATWQRLWHALDEAGATLVFTPMGGYHLTVLGVVLQPPARP